MLGGGDLGSPAKTKGQLGSALGRFRQGRFNFGPRKTTTRQLFRRQIEHSPAESIKIRPDILRSFCVSKIGPDGVQGVTIVSSVLEKEEQVGLGLGRHSVLLNIALQLKDGIQRGWRVELGRTTSRFEVEGKALEAPLVRVEILSLGLADARFRAKQFCQDEDPLRIIIIPAADQLDQFLNRRIEDNRGAKTKKVTVGLLQQLRGFGETTGLCEPEDLKHCLGELLDQTLDEVLLVQGRSERLGVIESILTLAALATPTAP